MNMQKRQRNFSVDENYDYTLMLTWLPVAQEWNASLSWHETFW